MVECTDRMLSIVIYLLLLQQISSIEQFQTIQVTLASSVELPCSTINQTNELINPAKIVWIRDDRADIVSLDSSITVRDNRFSILSIDHPTHQERTLRIHQIEEEDHGLYRCMQGDLILNEILLDVLVPPRIIAHSPQNMRLTVREGRTARFSCRATGHPEPKIIWHVNGLSRPGIISMVDGRNESILILRNISRLQSGRVDCSASNALSTVNRQFLLYVKYKPIVSVPFHVLHFRLSETATITCQVCAIPSPTIFDFFRPKQTVPIIKNVRAKYDQVINQTCTRLILTIDLNETSLFGSYVCRARNSVGVHHAEFVLKEIIQASKHVKHTTESRSSSTTLSPIKDSSLYEIIEHSTQTSQRNLFTTEKNHSTKFSQSIFLFIIIFIVII